MAVEVLDHRFSIAYFTSPSKRYKQEVQECLFELFDLEDPGPGHVPVAMRQAADEASDFPSVPARLSSLVLVLESFPFPPSCDPSFMGPSTVLATLVS